jgi:hypothetical protein
MHAEAHAQKEVKIEYIQHNNALKKQLKMYTYIYRLIQTRTMTCYNREPSSQQKGHSMTNKPATLLSVLSTMKIRS